MDRGQGHKDGLNSKKILHFTVLILRIFTVIRNTNLRTFADQGLLNIRKKVQQQQHNFVLESKYSEMHRCNVWIALTLADRVVWVKKNSHPH